MVLVEAVLIDGLFPIIFRIERDDVFESGLAQIGCRCLACLDVFQDRRAYRGVAGFGIVEVAPGYVHPVERIGECAAVVGHVQDAGILRDRFGRLLAEFAFFLREEGGFAVGVVEAPHLPDKVDAAHRSRQRQGKREGRKRRHGDGSSLGACDIQAGYAPSGFLRVLLAPPCLGDGPAGERDEDLGALGGKRDGEQRDGGEHAGGMVVPEARQDALERAGVE